MSTQQLKREALEAMGIAPMVLRTRPVMPPTDAPALVESAPTPAPAAAVVPEAPFEPPKIELAPEPKPVTPPPSAPAVVDEFPVLNFAVLHFGDLMVVAQLPQWAQGLIEASCRGFFRDLSLHLPAPTEPEETLALPKHQTPTVEDYRDLIQGRLMRAAAQGTRRLLLLCDHQDPLTPAVPQDWALYSGPGLNSLMESAEHKRALWSTLQRLRG